MGELTPEQRAEDVLSTFRRNAQSASIKAIIATAIRAAEERGRLAERERCARVADDVASKAGCLTTDCEGTAGKIAAAIRAGDERESER